MKKKKTKKRLLLIYKLSGFQKKPSWGISHSLNNNNNKHQIEIINGKTTKHGEHLENILVTFGVSHSFSINNLYCRMRDSVVDRDRISYTMSHTITAIHLLILLFALRLLVFPPEILVSRTLGYKLHFFFLFRIHIKIKTMCGSVFAQLQTLFSHKKVQDAMYVENKKKQ